MNLFTQDRLSGLNPLRGLTLDGFVSMIEQGELGYYADLQWLYRIILRRNATARAVRRKLKGALGRLDWDIKLRSDATGFDKAKADAQQKTLRAAYEQISNLKSAIGHLAMADLLGFAHCEKIYAGAEAKRLRARGKELERAESLASLDPWVTCELRIVPQWHLCREGVFGPWLYNREAQSTNNGMPAIPCEHWIVREVDDPAAEIFTFAHLKMSVTDADWDQFCDTFAVPPIFVIMPPNVSDAKAAEFQSVAEAVVSDGRGAMPHGADVKTVEVGSGSSASIFTERLRFYREEIVLAGTGGILTTLDGNTGIGKGPAEEHDDTWLDIAAEIGAAISETLQHAFDAPLLAKAHKGEPVFAYFELDKPVRDPSPNVILEDATLADALGLALDIKELNEKTGYTFVAKQQPTAPASEILPIKQEPGAAPTIAAPGGHAATLPASPTTPTDASHEAKPPEAVAPPAAPQGDSPAASLPGGTGDPPVPAGDSPAGSSRTSAAGEAKPSLVERALADSLDVDARVFAPVKPYLDEIERLLTTGADPDAIIAKLEETIAALPDLLGQLDIAALTDAIEAAAGTAAVQGVRDAIAAKALKSQISKS